VFKSLIALKLKCPRATSRRGLSILDQRGVTLIELVIAVSVFAVVAAGFTLAMGTSLNITRNNRNRTIAANLASVEMDTIRSTDFEELEAGDPAPRVETVDGVNYTIKRATSWENKAADTTACDAPGGAPEPSFLKATVTVTWPNMAGAAAVTSQTILAPPIGVYDPSAGHIAVKVLDSQAQPASGHLVTTDGPGGAQSRYTVAGCAFFPFLAEGSYTVALGTTGFVDGEGNPTPSQLAAVSRGSITPVQFDYDEAATLELTLGDDPAYPVPALNGLDVTVANPALQLGSKVFAGTGSLRPIGNLYPYSDGYQAWAGNCPENDPQGLTPEGAPIWPDPPGALRAPALASLPGQVTVGNIVMKRVEVQVTDFGGVPQPGRQVTASFAGNGSCSSLSADLGTTDTNGKVFASLPYGSWVFTAMSQNVNFALDPTAADPALVQVQG
jgi:prepilin-type N-terminal cleavage/methylation domain-containing protein